MHLGIATLSLDFNLNFDRSCVTLVCAVFCSLITLFPVQNVGKFSTQFARSLQKV